VAPYTVQADGEPVVTVSITTPKQLFGPDETVNATVTTTRGGDVLTSVWEGDLTFDAIDNTSAIVYTKVEEVYLPTGGSMQTFHFEFTLATEDVYSLMATLRGNDGTLVDTQQITIWVRDDGQNLPPVAVISPDEQTIALGEEAELMGNGSYDPDGRVVSYEWEFGDGITATGAKVTHAYRAQGVYTVTLTVTDDEGATGTSTGTVRVTAGGPDMMVWIDSLSTDHRTYEAGGTVTAQVIVERGPDLLTSVWEGSVRLDVLDGSMTLVYSHIVDVDLDYGGESKTVQFTFDLDEAGDYTVRAELHYFDAVVDTEEVTITVTDDGPNKPPVAAFDPVLQKVTLGEEALFKSNGSHDPDGRVVSYHWDFGDGSTGSGVSAVHVYPLAGTYTVLLTVTDDDGATATAAGAVEVTEGVPDRMAWIISLTTEKDADQKNGTVIATVTVERGPDMLTYVWEGALKLDVFNSTNALVYTEMKAVALNSGGDEATLEFTFDLISAGDYVVRASLHYFDAVIDTKEVPVTVGGEPPREPRIAAPLTVPTPAVAAVGVLAIVGGVYATEIGKSALLGLMMPLYTKLRKKEVLDQFTRGKIYGYILANPGENYNSVQKALDMPNGSFAYHLQVLEREEFVRSGREGTRRYLYPYEMRIPSTQGTLKRSQLLILEKIRDTPGISQKDIASFLGVSQSTVNYHIKELLGLGIIRTERRGMRLRYFLNADRRTTPNLAVARP
jgi:predicted transcriptional regulator/PKD repeat protein